jgi:predicted Zn-dependent peptidase
MIKSIEKISTASGFSAISSGIRNPQQYGKIPDNAIFSKEKSMAFEQAHCVIGNRAWSLHHPGRFALSLLNNLLAGPAMSSLISYQLREKLGLAYHVEGNFSAFEDTGQWLLYFATDPESLDKAKDQVFKTLKSLCDRQLGSLQLSRAKKQFAGQVFLMQDSNLQNILNAGKSLMTYQVVEGIEEIVKQIDSISGTSLLEAANEILAVDQLSVLEYRPKRR